MKSKTDRLNWIMEYFSDDKYQSVDILDSGFVYKYVEETGATAYCMMIGAPMCRQLGRDLSELFKTGKLSRGRIGLGNGLGPGFPKWVYSYYLPNRT